MTPPRAPLLAFIGDEDGDDVLGKIVVQFFLRYQGPLPSCSRSDARTTEKDAIRRQLSPQLKDLWETHPGLKSVLVGAISFPKKIAVRGLSDEPMIIDEETTMMTTFGHAALRGWKFIPLVLRSMRWICELHVTFLRREDPGALISGGDIDNRLKTLFDGLRIPYEESELHHDRKADEDECCFCLLEDDALISSVHVETDRLYGPLGADTKKTDVDLLIRVTIKKYNRDLGFI